MRVTLYTCEWCGKSVKVGPEAGAPSEWVGRSGQAIAQKESAKENRQWLEPVKRRLDLCSAACNDAATSAEAAADEAARKAWVQTYQNMKV